MSSIEEKVIAEIRQRAEKGEAKYGTTMDRDDLSLKEWLQHLKEELMDGVIYIQKIINALEVLENLEIAQDIMDVVDALDTQSNTLYIEEE